MSTAAGWNSLPEQFDDAAAKLLADCAAIGSVESAKSAIAAARNQDDVQIVGWLENGDLIGVYGLRRGKLNYDLLWLAIAPDWRGRRYGRSALVDALRRCGRKPLTVEADEQTRPWFESIGFRTVGRRPKKGGGFRYRLGWYAPRLPQEPGYGAHG